MAHHSLRPHLRCSNEGSDFWHPTGFTRDPDGGTRAGFSATAQLDRKDFGIATSPLVGSLLAGDRVQVFIQIRAVLTAPQPADA